MNKKIGLIIGVVVLLIVVLGLPFAVKLVQERQNPQKKAAVPGGSASLSLSAANTATVQQRIPVTIAVKAPASPDGIIGMTTTLRITSTGNAPLVRVTADDITKPLSPSFTYYDPIIEIDGSTTTVIIDSTWLQSGTGYLDALNSFQNFTVINLLATGEGTVNIAFDMNNSFVKDKNGNLDILNDQAGEKSITITGGNVTSVTPTTVSTTAALTPTINPSGAATITTLPTNPTGTITATLTPTTEITSSITPTTAGRGGGTLPTNTPSPVAGADQVKITSVTSGQTVPTNRPNLSGTAVPNSTVTITIRSNPVTATVTADASGHWTWVPTVDLAPGNHSITVTAVSPQGKTTTTTSTITVGSLPITGNISLTVLLLISGLLILFPVFILNKKNPC